MKIQFKVLFTILTLFCAAAGDNTPQSSAEQTSPEIIEKYGVTIRKRNGRGKNYLRWEGVILNEKFVLSADLFEKQLEYYPRELSVSIYHIGLADAGVGLLNGSKVLLREKRDWSVEHIDVERVWVLQSLLLLKVMKNINFDRYRQHVHLPDQYELKAWKNSSAIPNNENFTSSFWFRERNSEYFFRQVFTSQRKCSRRQLLREKLIPSCFRMKYYRTFISLRTGAGLIYKNTLVGIRKHTKYVAPYGDFPEDYFINVALQTEMLTDIMERGLQCRY